MDRLKQIKFHLLEANDLGVKTEQVFLLNAVNFIFKI